MTERKLLAAFIKAREAWQQVGHRLGKDDFTEQGTFILEQIGSYYESDPSADHVDVELLSQAVSANVKADKHKKALTQLVEEVAGEDVSATNTVRLYVDQKKEVIGSKLAQALVGGPGQRAAIPSLIAEYEDWDQGVALDGGDTHIIQDLDVVDLAANSYSSSSLIRIAPKALNDRVGGGLLRGHHLILFARPEMGKTLTLCCMIRGFLQQQLRVLYAGNEEPVEDTYLRMVTALTGLHRSDVLANPADATAKAREKGLPLLTMAHLTPGSPREIESLCEKYQPDVLIVDQLRNLRIKDDNFTHQLELAARMIRQVGQRQKCLVISVTQAGDSASGKAVLDMSDVDSSKTGIPAQADVLLGLGGTDQDIDANRRVFSLTKNKPGNNHDHFVVFVDTATSRMRS